jgi:hypothetical protein
MKSTTTDNIKEIAEQLDFGFRAFIHKTTGQLLFVPNENDFPDFDLDSWDKELEQLKNNYTDYHEIDKWTSSEAFEIMNDFAEQLTEKNLQDRLFNALRKNKPFREFRSVIDNSGDYRQQWFDFMDKWQQDYVARQLIRLNSTETNDGNGST